MNNFSNINKINHTSNVQKFEFKSYTPTPNDQYHLGIATVLLYGNFIARFKHVKTKDGKGDFFAAPSYTILDPVTQEKRYLQAFMMDSRSDDEDLQECIRNGYHAVMKQRSALSSQVNSSPQIFNATPSSGTVSDNLPF